MASETEAIELREIFRERVGKSFARARECVQYARDAREAGRDPDFAKWVWCVRALRVAASRWRQRAKVFEGLP